MSIELIASVVGNVARFSKLTDPSSGIASNFMRNWRQAAMRSVRLAKKYIEEAMASQSLAPLSQITVALKGTNTLLVESGTLKSAIVARQEGPNVFYGGIDVDVKNEKGMSMGWLATLHQSGYTIEVTPAIRQLFKSIGVNLREDTRVLVVPPRPFVMMGLEKAIEEIRKSFLETARTTVQTAGAG